MGRKRQSFFGWDQGGENHHDSSDAKMEMVHC